MSRYKNRLLLSFLGLALVASLTLWHLHQIQQVRGDLLSRRAWQINSQLVALEQFERGEIRDCHGVSLSGGYAANRLVIFPALLGEQEQVLKTLAAILGLKPEQLATPGFGGGAFFVPRALTPVEQTKIEELDLPGVYLLPVEQRYGAQPLAVHLTGHLGKIDSKEQFDRLQRESPKQYRLGDWVGRSGLELFYEEDLKGSFGSWARVPVDVRGRAITGAGLLVDSGATDPGRLHIITTIDHRVQRIVEEVLDEHGYHGAVVVMQAGSENILALVSRPGYNPDPGQMAAHVTEPGEEVFVDHGTALQQPGSVFKVVLAAAALEQGLAGPGDPTFHCAGGRAQPVNCWSEPGHGTVTLAQALAHSCNPAFVELGRLLGAQSIIQFARALGLDNQSITGYPQKADPRQDLSLVARDYNLANSSVGQGPVLVTPVQVTAMMNVIASGGVYYQPRLVSELQDDAGAVMRRIPGPAPQRAMSRETAAELQNMLVGVTLTGVGQKARVPEWGSAGKTGSAQVTGSQGPINAWFTGYVPEQQPRYVITVLVRDGQSGGGTAAPLFQTMATRMMSLPPEL